MLLRGRAPPLRNVVDLKRDDPENQRTQKLVSFVFLSERRMCFSLFTFRLWIEPPASGLVGSLPQAGCKGSTIDIERARIIGCCLAMKLSCGGLSVYRGNALKLAAKGKLLQESFPAVSTATCTGDIYGQMLLFPCPLRKKPRPALLRAAQLC